jgi:hypothetical protein
MEKVAKVERRNATTPQLFAKWDSVCRTLMVDFYEFIE